MVARPNDYTDFAHTAPGTLAGRYLRTFWQPGEEGTYHPWNSYEWTKD